MREWLRLSVPILVAASVLVAPTRAQDAASAKKLIESLYRNYTMDGSGTDATGPKAHLYFHSSLIALFRADVKANGPDSMPAVDAEPACDCQEWLGIWDLKINIQIVSRERAIAHVSFALAPPEQRDSAYVRRMTLTLVPEQGQWRIWNIVDEGYPSAPFDTRKVLRDDIRSLTKSR
jgi:hypothetical protein